MPDPILPSASQPFTIASLPSVTSQISAALFNLCHLCSIAPLRQAERPPNVPKPRPPEMSFAICYSETSATR